MSFKLDLNLENYFWESRCCMGCAMCKYGDWIYVPADHEFSFICPEWQWGKFDNWGATGRTRLINALLVGDLDWSEPLIHEAAFRCFSCGGCDVGCKRNLDLEILLMNQSLKVALVDHGYARPEHQALIKKINNQNTYNFFTDEGLLPNYAFPETGVILRSIIYRIKKDSKDDESNFESWVYEYERPAVSAID